MTGSMGNLGLKGSLVLAAESIVDGAQEFIQKDFANRLGGKVVLLK